MSTIPQRTGQHPETPLPSKGDFVRFGSLDEECAWKNFGGLSIDAARLKFDENPLYYEEDFMWMGRSAFAFYFPVIDSFLRNTEPGDWWQHRSLSLCESLRMQFEQVDNLSDLRPIAKSVIELAEFVCDKVRHVGDCDAESPQVADALSAWSELSEYVKTVTDLA